MKNIINKLVFGSLTVALSSCIGNYENINSNPYEAPDLSADGYALGSAMNNLAGCVVSPDVNTAQFTDCLLGGPLGGYFADSNAGFTETISNFNPKDDWSRVFLKSDKIIPTLYSNLTQVKLVSQNTNDPVPYAIAQVIKVAAMHRVTDAFGPIPYSQIGANGEIATPYDSQEVTYNTFFDELNAAIATLNENSNEQLVPTADYIYKGDVKKWIRFANSLKLRLAIRIAYANPVKAQQMAEEAVNPANGGVIESNADNATWNYFETSQNPIYVATRYNQVQANKHSDNKDCTTGGDTHAAADIICYMNGYKDPRREKMFTTVKMIVYDENFQPQEVDGYAGIRIGIDVTTKDEMVNAYSIPIISSTSPFLWMNAAEITFLRAEGALRGWNMGGEAKDLYNMAIALSFEQYGLSGSETYAKNSTDTPEAYNDPTFAYTDWEGPRSTITIAWEDGADNFERNLERIITQKWIANFPLGVESWSEFRRTGYPHLMPVIENKSGGSISSEYMIRRLWYPPTEYTENLSNINLAIGMLGGPDNGGTRLWWDKKSYLN